MNGIDLRQISVLKQDSNTDWVIYEGVEIGQVRRHLSSLGGRVLSYTPIITGVDRQPVRLFSEKHEWQAHFKLTWYRNLDQKQKIALCFWLTNLAALSEMSKTLIDSPRGQVLASTVDKAHKDYEEQYGQYSTN